MPPAKVAPPASNAAKEKSTASNASKEKSTPAATPRGVKPEVETRRQSAWAEPSASSTTSPVTKQPSSEAVGPVKPFLAISPDLCGLVLSSWFVPTVKKPFKGVPTFILAIVAQTFMLGYMVLVMLTEDKSPCGAPAVLLLVGLFVFGSACMHELNSFSLLQIALVTTQLKIPGQPEVDNLGRLKQGKDQLIPIRQTSRCHRYLLCLFPLAEMMIEVLTMIVGAAYLCLSENVEELILNAVAVNFVTQIDDIMLHAFAHKASRERLNKYQFEMVFGVEDGDTQLKNASDRQKLMLRLQEWLPLFVVLLSVGCVAGAQFWGRSKGDTCYWVFTEASWGSPLEASMNSTLLI